MATLEKSYLIPEPINWTQKTVQDFAADTARKLDYTPGGDIEAVVRLLGGVITNDHWDSESDTGYVEVRGPMDFTIGLSPFANGRRRRFTIAHELGHYILHSRVGKVAPIKISRDGTGRLEWEANWFAAGFLMPESEFRAFMEVGMNDAEIAHEFGVSKSAVEIRRSVLE